MSLQWGMSDRVVVAVSTASMRKAGIGVPRGDGLDVGLGIDEASLDEARIRECWSSS